MARHIAWIVLLLLACCASATQAQMSFGGGKRELPPARRGDLPHLSCAVCQLWVKQALRTLRSLREELKPGKKLEEADLIDKLELLCDATKGEGEWLRQLDIVEGDTTLEVKDMGKVDSVEGDRVLEVEDMGKMGKHTSETSTLAKACSVVSEDLDLSDISEALYTGKARAVLTQMACYDMSKACAKKPPPLPQDRPAGDEFEPLSEDELNRERLMSKLAASGMGGQMYDRDSLKNQMEELQGAADAGAFESVKLSEVPAGSQVGGGGVVDRLKQGAVAAAEGAARAAAAAKQRLGGLLGRLAGGGGGSQAEL